MKKLLIILAAMATFLGACSTEQKTADGQLQSGVRVITLGSGFSGADIQAYRGETVSLVLSGEGTLKLSVPDFEAEEVGSGEVTVEFKAAKAGEYAIIAVTPQGEETGTLVISEYENADVYKNVDAADFKEAMTGNYLILDVRSKYEYESGHIEGALLIPHTELQDRLDEVKGYDKVLVYCASGNRSIAASQILINAGFEEVYNLNGGYKAWQN